MLKSKSLINMKMEFGSVCCLGSLSKVKEKLDKLMVMKVRKAKKGRLSEDVALPILKIRPSLLKLLVKVD